MRTNELQSPENIIKNGSEPVFTRKTDYKGYNVKAWFLKEPNQNDALIEIFKDGEILRSFLFPAYKIYNISAHFIDIVEGEIKNNMDWYNEAAWDGISNSVVLIPREAKL